MSKKTVRDIELSGKKVFVRCDFNVPMDENQNITDNRRIVAALPTIKYLIEQNCKVILSSHLGRPKGEFKSEYSLAPVAAELARLLGQEVLMAKDGAAGVYDKDPDEGNAKKYATLNYNDFIDAQLQVADGTAIMLARDRLIPLFFFDFSLESILKKIIEGEATGTLVADVPTTFE